MRLKVFTLVLTFFNVDLLDRCMGYSLFVPLVFFLEFRRTTSSIRLFFFLSTHVPLFITWRYYSRFLSSPTSFTSSFARGTSILLVRRRLVTSPLYLGGEGSQRILFSQPPIATQRHRERVERSLWDPEGYTLSVSQATSTNTW